jgi:hypothetical protein
MIVFVPYAWNPEIDVITNIAPETFDDWNPLLRYSFEDVVTESDKTWVANVSSVDPIEPLSTDPILYNEGRRPSEKTIVPAGYESAGSLWWNDASDDPYVENRYRMFGPNPSRITKTYGNIEVTLTPSEPYDAIAFFNVQADFIEVTQGSYHTVIDLRYEDPICAEFPNKTTAALVDLPSVPTGALHIVIRGSLRQISIGYLAVGQRVEIGNTLYDTEISIVDYSRKDREFDGTVRIIDRGFTDLIKYRFRMDSEDIYAAKQYFAEIRADFAVFIGKVDRPETIVFGLYKDLLIPVEDYVVVEATLEVESVVQDHPSEDPPPNCVVIIEPNGTECIEEFKKFVRVCLVDGKVVDPITATPNIEIEETDTLLWTLTWLQSEGDNDGIPYRTETLETDCEQSLSLLIWPAATPEEVFPGYLSVGATVVKEDETRIELWPATVAIDECNECANGQCPCVIKVEDHGFSDSSDDYALKSTTETVTLDAKEIDFRVPTFIQGCAGEDRYYWCNVTPSPGYGIAYWSIELGEGASACAYAVLDGIPTTSAFVHRCGAGKVGVPTWEGASNVVILVEYSETETTQLTVDATFGVPMNDTIVLILPPGDTEDLVVSETDPTYYLTEIPIEDGETLDAVVVTVGGGSDLTIYVGVGTDPFPTESDSSIVGDGSLTLTPLNTPGAGTLSVMLMIPPTVGYEGGVTLNVQPVYAQTLTIQSATHGQTAANIALVQAHTLTVQSTTHGHTADTARAIPDVTLEVQSATHGQIADSAQVLQHFTLEVQSATHGQTADHIGNDSVLRDSATAIIRDVNGSILRVKTGGLIT